MPHTKVPDPPSPEQVVKLIEDFHRQLCRWLEDAPSHYTSILNGARFFDLQFHVQEGLPSEFDYRHLSNPPIFALSPDLLRAFGRLANDSIDKCAELIRLFLLHEAFHIRQGLTSYGVEGIGRFGFVLEAVDYDADAYAIDVCLSFRNAQRSPRTLEDLADIIDSVVSGINAFRSMTSEPLVQILARRLRRLLIWNFQLARARSFRSNIPADFPLHSRVVIEIANLPRAADPQTSTESVDLTHLPESAELAVYTDGRLFRIDDREIVSALLDSIKQDNRDGSVRAFEAVFNKHAELLEPRRAAFGVGLTSPLSETANVRYFDGETTHECHQRIATRCKGRGPQPNFVSIVRDARYTHPPTTEIGGQPAAEDLVHRAFYALHPEYHKGQGWKSSDLVRESLSNLRPRYQFHHGPRLFGLPHLAPKRHATESLTYGGPIGGVLSELARREGRHRAYAGLYNADLDAQQSLEPMPALVGVQFIPNEGDRLDAVAFFRRLELSFWWPVNMMEMCELLEFVADQSNMKPGTISFLASVAEWKSDPEVSYQALLDSTDVPEMLEIVFHSLSGVISTLVRLRDMLDDKAATTSDVNLDASGLELLADILSHSLALGIPKKIARERREKFKDLEQLIRNAVAHIKAAIADRRRAREKVGHARTELKAAVAILNNLQTSRRS